MKQLRNLMATAVKTHVDVRLREGDICSCDNCRLDMIAITLNKLPSHYVNVEVSALQNKVDAFEAENREIILASLADAAKKVKNNPQHD